MNFSEVLNAVIADGSAYAAAKKIGVTPTAFYRWQNGKRTPSDEQLNKIIDFTGLDPAQVYLAAYAEKIHNVKAAAAFRHLAA